MSEHRSETVAIHAGRPARVEGEPLNPPLVPVSNFHRSGYAREQDSPGWAPFETAIGALEGGTTIAFASERHTVHYPGLVSDPGYERATRLMDGYGAMLSFEHAEADEVRRRVRVITHAKSLGGVESLIERRAPGLLRLSVGCEHVEDLWNDLEQAL